MDYPKPCVGAVIERGDGRILVLKSNKWSGKYIIVGGHVEVDEHPEDAVRREVKEETGLDVEVKSLIQMICATPENYAKQESFLMIDYYCVGDGSVRADEGEFSDVKWVTPLEALYLDLDEYSRDTIKKFIGLKKI